MNQHHDAAICHHYFFDSGIRFECRRCGNCCTGSPGIVRISPQEIDSLADYLKLSAVDFIRLYLCRASDGLCLAEEKNGNCCFYHHGCTIYPVRPKQCKTYPFWFSSLRSDIAWENTCRECPGIGTGWKFTRDQILELLSESMGYNAFL